MRPSAVFAATACLIFSACSQEPPPAPPAPPSSDAAFGRVEHTYVVYFLSRFPVVATYLGGASLDVSLATVDGRLRKYSAGEISAEDLKFEDFRKEFTGFDPGTLSPRRRIDRDVALAQIEFLRHQHQARKYQQRSIDSYVDEPFRGVDFQLQGMADGAAGSYGTAPDWQRVVERVESIGGYLAIAQQQLEAGIADRNTPDWRLIVAYGLESARADAEYFSKTLPALARQRIGGEQKDALLKAIDGASAAAAKAYTKFAEFVAARYFINPKGSDETALKPQFRADRYLFGEAEYNWALKNNLRVDRTADQLYDESWAVVEETRRTMIALATEIAKARGWQAPEGPGVVRVVFDQLSADAPKSDEEMIEGYRATGARIVDYARNSGLFDVPNEYKLDVTVTPPPLRSSIDGAAYYTAPPFKTGGIGRFYVSPTGNDPAKLREEHNRAKMADLAAHEGFPGHDWNYRVMIGFKNEISLVRWLTPGAVEDSSSMWSDSLAAEGWALYSEALLAEPQPQAPHGFYTPEEHLYQLQGKLYRDLRVRIDTGLHTGKLSVVAAKDLFSTVVDFLPGSCLDAKALKLDAKRASCDAAGKAIDRYARWPTQAITYRLGKEMIFALRKRAQESLGDKFSAKAFHLAFMRQGSISPGYFGDELIAELKAAK